MRRKKKKKSQFFSLGVSFALFPLSRSDAIESFLFPKSKKKMKTEDSRKGPESRVVKRAEGGRARFVFFGVDDASVARFETLFFSLPPRKKGRDATSTTRIREEQSTFSLPPFPRRSSRSIALSCSNGPASRMSDPQTYKSQKEKTHRVRRCRDLAGLNVDSRWRHRRRRKRRQEQLSL